MRAPDGSPSAYDLHVARLLARDAFRAEAAWRDVLFPARAWATVLLGSLLAATVVFRSGGLFASGAPLLASLALTVGSFGSVWAATGFAVEVARWAASAFRRLLGHGRRERASLLLDAEGSLARAERAALGRSLGEPGGEPSPWSVLAGEWDEGYARAVSELVGSGMGVREAAELIGAPWERAAAWAGKDMVERGVPLGEAADAVGLGEAGLRLIAPRREVRRYFKEKARRGDEAFGEQK